MFPPICSGWWAAAAQHAPRLLTALRCCRRVELKPTLQTLFDTVAGVCKRVVALTDGIPRVTQDVIEGCSSTYGAASICNWCYWCLLRRSHTDTHCAWLQLPALLTTAPAASPYVDLINKNEDAVLKQMQVGGVAAGMLTYESS